MSALSQSQRDVLHAQVLLLSQLPVGSEVIWADQNAPRPDHPYITMNLVNGGGRYSDTDDKIYSDGDPGEVDETARSDRRVTLSLNALTDSQKATESAAFFLGEVESRLGLDSVESALSVEGLAILRRGEVRDLSALLDSRIENRAQVDLLVGYVTEVTVADVDHVLSVDIKIDDPNLASTVTVTDGTFTADVHLEEL